MQQTMLRRFRRDLASLGIEEPSSGPRRLHSMRHTFVTQLRAAALTAT